MFLLKRLMPVLAACCLLASCASSTPLVSAPPKPLPVALLALCPPPPERTGADMDALAIDLKRGYDAYGVCAGLHAELVRWLEQADKDAR